MDSLKRFVLAAFGLYRVAKLISQEEGPYLWFWKSNSGEGVFLHLRMSLGAGDIGPGGSAETNLGRGISCPFCVGLWLAPLFWCLLTLENRWADRILELAGLAGIQVFLQELSN